ncbi:hemolysin family protein [Corynebacterium pygosceleis]|uniref:Hemolysin family protein n=1 Tax=Corynebacterium pygosceleis TaxID=2800406 RepID=A0A9Q4C7H5_9CORY|nr:hemolysin family protein [Corynebacterium pygosceleis]MCK7637105.1 hemolysin family protein [Corynebacterium pygosceleis]MCK7674579.1 hemolysin family protein [Corynebacterium pygosceleis]MCL0120119.1 hemolysin family protein [Corynebacterium pygosceleis]MCX7443667.1 hemolysin family protein [Corynebacterium pygosceleis]MCX7467859.1 hemolysin family protein [Corynebacterium pygosceleis]
MNDYSAVLFAVALLFINAFFVGAEFSLISSRRDRLDSLIAQGKSRARSVLWASERLSMMLAGAQFGITIASLLLGKVAEPAIAHIIEGPAHALGLPDNLLHPVAFAVALGIVTYLHIVLGEMVPKNIALAGPETVAMILVPPHMLFVKVTRPVIVAMNWFAGVTLRMFGIEQREEMDTSVGPQQLATMITESRSEGLLDAEEHARLNKALRSDDRTIREVLIACPDVRTLEFGTKGPTLGAVEHAVSETGYSRFPVTGLAGNYVGYIHVKDILDRMVSPDATLDDVVKQSELRPLITVEAAGTLDDTMRLMRRRSAHMAQVRDERGELVGIVTLEDLIEEFVGTVRDWTHEEA